MITEILIVREEGLQPALKDIAAQAARSLKANGLKVREQVTVAASADKLAAAVAAGLARSNILVVIGGMGAGTGYMAKRVVGEGLRLPLCDDDACLAAVRAYCERTGESFQPEDAALASLPRGARAFPPAYGKLPGCAISSSRQHIVLLPENPREILPMLQNEAIPYLMAVGVTGTAAHYVRAVGIEQERAQELLSDLTASANPVVTVERDGGEVLIRVAATAVDTVAAASLCTPVLRTVAQRLGDCAYGLDVDSLEAAVVQKMLKKGLGLAVVEFGTGGMLTRVLTEAPRGQEVLRYAAAADEDEARLGRLGIPVKKLRKKGFVSEYAAVAMADAARRRANCEVGAAVCAAPPEYGNKKTGVVYIAVCDASNVYVKKLVVSTFDEADGDAVIDASVARALNMIRLFVDYYPARYRASVPLEPALQGKRTVTDRNIYDDDAFGDILTLPRQSAAAAVFGNLIIRKTDGALTVLKKFIFILATLTFLGCGGYLGYYYYDSFTTLHGTEQLRELYSAPPDAPANEIAEDYPGEYADRFAALWAVNPDVAGYVKIDGTNVDYPVVQGGDNREYMRRAFDGGYSNHGVPFLDFRADAERPSDNLVIYGHNMRDGQAFADLLNYRDAEFYREHPIVRFDSLYRETQYVILSVFITSAAGGEGDVFNYHDMVDAASDEDFSAYLNQLRVRSLIDTGVEAQPGDKLLTLSTCDYDFDDARFVVTARALREGESPEDIDVSGAKENPAPLYPDIWYKTFGGERPNLPSASVVTTAAPDSGAPLSSVMVSWDGIGSSSGEDELEASRLAVEAASKAEILRLAAEASSKAEVSRLAAEASSKAEASRLAAEASSKAEASRLAAETNRKKREADAKSAMNKAENEYIAALDACDLAADASTASAAQRHATIAKSSAERAREAAEAARAAADEANTDAARLYASQAALFAESAQEAADVAAELAETFSQAQTGSTPSAGSGAKIEKLTLYSGGTKYEGDALEMISRVVQNEVGSSFHTEAIKAQAVAAYTYVAHSNASGTIPTLSLASKADTKVKNAVQEVLGQAVYYNGSLAFTTFFATSAGATTSSKDVWGGSYPYLVSVDSSIEEQLSSFAYTKRMTRQQVEELIYSKLGIEADGDPEDWFEIIDEAAGGYNGRMSVCGETKSKKTGSTITGRLLRESVLSLRSACFTVDYDDDSDRFTFTTYGYGHGVGLSQNGANLYASQKGWDYVEILEHYYPGATVK